MRFVGSRGRRWGARGLVLALLVASSAAALSVAPAPVAQAAGRVQVTSALGSAVASADAPTTVDVSGSGFQSVPGGFGGVYVLFGWVSDADGGSWRPSEGGATGETYLYVPDSESADNQGYQRFVTFPGSSTAEAANGGTLSEDGRFELQMVIPGPTFTGRDRSGAESAVDCREVTCGIITVGAHGVVNATNESFTPVRFEGAGGAGQTGTGGAEQDQQPATDQSSGQGAGGTGAPGAEGQPAATDPGAPAGTGPADGAPATDGAGGGPAAAAPDVPATVGVEQTTIVVGRVVAFTGQGFVAGEQVVASLSGGVAAAGPLVAGTSGEVAGVLVLPADLRPGSHPLRLTGAASGETPEVALTVVADPLVAAAEANARDAGAMDAWDWGLVVVGGLGILLLALVVSSLVTAVVRRRGAARPARRTS